MKLKTKFQDEDFDLGEVVEASIYHAYQGGFKLTTKAARGGEHTFYFESLKDLNNLFEDYEEPKRTWFIDTCCVPNYIDYGDNPITDHCYDDLNELGFCFETREEAEKVIEKLKAWKRLKDKGVEFYGWRKNHTGTYDFLARWKEMPPKMHDIIDDLDLLFGGEE